MVNKKRLVQLTQRLIQINSENPPGNEFEIAQFVKDYLKDLGLESKIFEFAKNRSNVVLVLEGKNKKHSLLITPHLDTVPCGKNWHFPPFKAQIKKGRIYGLGATDCKGNLACGIEVINSLIEERVVLGYNIIFAATADEESGSKWGLGPLLEKRIFRPDAVLVLDGDEFKIIVAQKGLLHLKVKIEGKKAHSAYPWLGINAIDIALEIIREIKQYKFSQRKNQYLKGPSINLGTIRGGDKVNVVADWCEFELDFRFLPGESGKKILQDVKEMVKKNSRKFSLEIEGIQEPFRIDKKHSLVDYLVKAMAKINLKPKIKGSEGATTISFFRKYNIASIATGFGNSGCAHIADEYVKIDNLYKGALVLEEFLKSYRFENGKI